MESASVDQLRDLRKRVLAQEPYTIDELRAAIQELSGDRLAQLTKAATKAPRKAPVKAVDLADLL